MKHQTTIDPIQRAAAFAAGHIAGRSDLQTDDFPRDIWQKMGKAGFFKIGIKKIHGGTGGGYLELLKAGEAFVQHGHNMGLALSWLYQQIIARCVITAFGTPAQKRQYLRAAAAGKITFSFAVSEPGRGAHPKQIATSAKKIKTGYILDGEKTYLTNGPMADVFIVITATDERTPRGFTAFAVPRGAGGLTVTPPLALPFLKPSLHGGIILERCLTEPKAVIGPKGSAWSDLVVPVGEIEDVVMTGPALGGMAAWLSGLTAAGRKHPDSSDPALLEALGGLHALLETARITAYEAARRLDRTHVHPASLVIAFGQLAADFNAGALRLGDAWNIGPNNPYAALQRDLQTLAGLKKKVRSIRQRKIGAELLKSV